MGNCTCRRYYDPAPVSGSDGVYDTRIVTINTGDCPVHPLGPIEDLWPDDIWPKD